MQPVTKILLLCKNNFKFKIFMATKKPQNCGFYTKCFAKFKI